MKEDMIDLKGKTVLVNFAGSMIGREIVKVLRQREAIPVEVTHKHYNLLDQDDTHKIFYNNPEIEYVINGCGINGNIKYNMERPADIFGESVYMNINTLGCSVSHGVKKVVTLLTSCAYSPSPKPLLERNFLHGKSPHETVLSHGLAKRAIFAYGRFLTEQCKKTNIVGVIFNNCYGEPPFERVEKLKVADHLVKKFCDAVYKGENEVIVWGSGKAKRELLFHADAAEATVRVLESYNEHTEPINIGCGQDVSIKKLAVLIKELTGFTGEIVFDTTKPDGQMRKLLDNSKMLKVLQWSPPTSLRWGLSQTIEYYRKNYLHANCLPAPTT